MNLTIGQAINHLRHQHGLRMTDLAQVLNIKPHLLSKICRDQKELNRTELSSIRYAEKMELRRACSIKLQPLRVKDVDAMPGKHLAGLMMGRIQEKTKK